MKISSLLFPSPVAARHSKRTLLYSPDDDPGFANEELIRFSLKLIERTLNTDLSAVSDRMPGPHRWPDTWPGEHYRLLAAMIEEISAKKVVEIGTFTGISSLSMYQVLPADGKLVTYDLLPWESFEDTCFKKEDFEDGRMRQVLADLANPSVFAEHAETLKQADFMFIDGPKDGVFEYKVAALLDTLDFDTPPYILFDDIKDWHMLKFWRELQHPKLDLTSFGHWTGTGLVRWGA